MRKLITIIFSSTIIGGLLYQIYVNYSDFFSDTNNIIAFLSSSLILIAIIYSALKQNHARKFFFQLLIWGTIFLFTITAYAFRFELDYVYRRTMAVLLPSYSWSSKPGELVIARNSDGHFYVNALVNNIKIKFMVDTGASDLALTHKDAQKLGLNTSKLKYTQTYLTANGPSKAAPIILDSIILGDAEFKKIPGHVGQGALDVSLLGMSLLKHFKTFKIDKDLLILNY